MVTRDGRAAQGLFARKEDMMSYSTTFNQQNDLETMQSLPLLGQLSEEVKQRLARSIKKIC